jgi:SecD/SecF fusion protein
MSRHLGWRVFVVFVFIAGAVALIVAREPRLGLDLRGGTQIVLEAQDTPQRKVDTDTVRRTVEVLRRRVDQLGVSEPTLQGAGERRIIVELPGVSDPAEALEVIGKTAQLTFHPVLGTAADDASTATTSEERVLADEQGNPLRLGPAALTGDAVGDARANLDLGSWHVEIDFRGDGGRAWEQLTGSAACAPDGDPKRRIAIVLDQDVISSPQVSPEVTCNQGISGGTTVITGRFTEREARDLSLLIRAGALPVPVKVVEQRTIGPTLGEEAVSASVRAAIIGATLTVLYIIVYYRLLGVLAAVALASYAAISFAVLLGIGATLTLPGVAGFVLAIGMAVDANVLVFERVKEEHESGLRVGQAAIAGFKRAWSAIADSNATTLLAAILLFYLASGAVRGFGVTLTVGVAVSMFTALVVTRVLVELLMRLGIATAHPGLVGLGVGRRFRRWIDERHPDLLRHSRRWLALSGIVLALAIAGIVARGVTYGVEFTGGRLLEYRIERVIDLDEARVSLAGAGFPRAIVQQSGGGNVAVRTQQLNAEEEARVRSAIAGLGGSAEKVRDEFVGPTIGAELRRKALIAIGLALVAQLGYMAIRFRWTYGAAAVGAMFHDVAILIGVFAWLGKSFDGVFLASLLTVIGYSVNDSVVVFDRIREQRRARSRDSFRDIANDACLHTLPRTLNTGLGALFILVALWLLGGETLADFALALLIGIGVGTYSSVFTATPIAIALEGRWPASPLPSRNRPAASRKTSKRPPPGGRDRGVRL